MKTMLMCLSVVFFVITTLPLGHAESHLNEERADHPGDANQYMHKASIPELIRRFESSERDAYQRPEKVITFLGDIRGKTIVDIGAGSGYFSVKLAA